MPETTPSSARTQSRKRPFLALAFTLAVLAALAAVSAMRDDARWNQWDGDRDASYGSAPGIPVTSSSTTLPPLFAADSRIRRAGVASWMSEMRGESASAFAADPLPVPYDPSQPISLDSTSTFGGVNYADVTDSGIPLQWVGNDADALISPGLRLRDFVTQDGAPFVRIDPAFVQRLEMLRRRAGELLIVSGYRHPAYNVTVGGHADSYHTAGRAADVWSPKHSSLELANMALAEMGCDIGIGLNEHTIHVDIRGELTSWTYPEAPISEAAFDAWTLVQCGRPVPSWLSQAAAEAWLDENLGQSVFEDDSAVPTNGTPNDLSSRPSAERLLAEYASAIAASIEQGRSTVGAGGIVLEFEQGSEPRIRYISASSAEATDLGLPPLIDWCTARGDAYVAYAVILPEKTSVGVSNELGIGGNAPLRPAPPPTGPERDVIGANSSRSRSGGSTFADPDTPTLSVLEQATRLQDEGWVVFTGSFVDEADAEARASSLGERLEASVFVVEAPQIRRYRVAVGPYATSRAATLALESFGEDIPVDAWIASL